MPTYLESLCLGDWERVKQSMREGPKYGPMTLSEHQAIECLIRAAFGSREPWLPTNENLANAYVFHHENHHA